MSNEISILPFQKGNHLSGQSHLDTFDDVLTIKFYLFCFFVLECNCFTMCWFLLYNKVDQLYVYSHM